MAKTFYSKCNIKFTKSSNSVTTGYEYPEDKSECKTCPFAEVVERYKGGSPVQIKQCQAGEKKPNKTTNCSSTGVKDSTNLHIQTLDMIFIKDLKKYIKDIPGVESNYFNAVDSGDCRKNFVISFEKNKKGIAAKKSIVEKFFPNSRSFETYIPKDEATEETNKKQLPGKMEYRAKCPYLSTIGQEYVQCTIHAKFVGKKEFTSDDECNKYTDDVCYGDFDKCEIYQNAYIKQMESTDNFILDHYKCAYCCNNSNYTGLQVHDGSTHGFCQLWQEDKLLFDKDTVCEWFNRKYRPQENVNGSAKENLHPDWPSQNCIKCEFCIDKQCSQGAFKNTSMIEINDNVKACPRFKEKNITEGIKEAENVHFDCTKCNDECKYNRDNMCTVENVKGHALEHFSKDFNTPDCIIMKNLRVLYLKEEKHCNNAHIGCNAVNKACSLNGVYCCYTCGDPCNSYCGYSKLLVPYGLLRLEDNAIIQADPKEPAHIFTMKLDSADGHETALNSHLQYIRKKSEAIVDNYVEIGFTLMNIRDNKLFGIKGYKNLIECVEAELNMKKSTCYNLIKIAEQFGNPDTKCLKSEYNKFNYVQCLEMSNMTQDELSQVNPDMTKRQMQKIKNSNRMESTPKENNQDNGVMNGQVNLIDDDNVIDVVSYSVIDNQNNSGQYLINNTIPEEISAAHEVENSEEFSYSEISNINDGDQDEDPQHEEDITIVSGSSDQAQDTNDNDSLYFELLNENENYRTRIAALEKDKETLMQLVHEIDSKFDKLSKKQIKSALWDFIATGEIIFNIE